MYKIDSIETMLKTAYKNIQKRIPESGLFKNFSACNWDIGEMFKEQFDFSIFVERDESVPGNIVVGLGMIEVNNSMIDSSVFLTCGNRDFVLEYLKSEQAEEDVDKGVKRLIVDYFHCR